MIAMIQGMCPMCQMGSGMILWWVLLLVAIVAIVWIIARRR